MVCSFAVSTKTQQGLYRLDTLKSEPAIVIQAVLLLYLSVKTGMDLPHARLK